MGKHSRYKWYGLPKTNPYRANEFPIRAGKYKKKYPQTRYERQLYIQEIQTNLTSGNLGLNDIMPHDGRLYLNREVLISKAKKMKGGMENGQNL